jgi:signal transduction histidine kinase/ActR/RegA family two-component response regulator
LYALHSQPTAYNAEDIEFLTALANRAAVGVGNLQLYEKLQNTNAHLARAAQMKDQFLASMSHELRTPLNAILGIAEGLREQYYGPLNEKQIRSTTIIEESGHHLLDLINDILDVAKVEAGEMTLNIDWVSVRMVCDSSLNFIKRMATNKQIAIQQEIKTATRLIPADPRRLKQILINLLSNAVKFTPQGGKVGLQVVENEDDKTVIFTVWDNGIGIASEDIPRLFEPFMQLDSELSRRYTGTGLGLALVKRMTEIHGGVVQVESAPGKGSRFSIILPIEMSFSPAADQLPDDVKEVFESDDGLDSAQKSAGNGRVLIIDDDKTNTEIFGEIMEMNGYEVFLAHTGQEGIDQFRKRIPDVILMDVQMPDMDGLEATQTIRKLPNGNAVKIIALTALAMEEDIQRCMDAGMDAFLSKPVPLQKLVATIKKFTADEDARD